MYFGATSVQTIDRDDDDDQVVSYPFPCIALSARLPPPHSPDPDPPQSPRHQWLGWLGLKGGGTPEQLHHPRCASVLGNHPRPVCPSNRS